MVSSDEGQHPVSKSVAETVSVRADPAPAPRPPLPEQLVIRSRPLRALAVFTSSLTPAFRSGADTSLAGRTALVD